MAYSPVATAPSTSNTTSTSNLMSTKHPRVRPPVSSALILVIVIICLIIPSPLSFSSSPSNLLSTVQSSDPLGPTNSNSTDEQKAKTSKLIYVPIETSNDAKATDKDNNDQNPTVPEENGMPPEGMKQCGHVLLFTAPRHGSTWFVDCVEKCAFTIANNGTFGHLNKYTELWNGGQDGPVLTISPEDAAEYVHENISLKVFPAPLRNFGEDVEKLTDIAYQKYNVPLVLLTRSLEDAFKSLATAQQQKVWNANTNMSNDAVASMRAVETNQVEIDEKQDEVFHRFVQLHYDTVRKMLNEKQYRFDELDYDAIRKAKYFVLEKNQCYINSCNYNQRT